MEKGKHKKRLFSRGGCLKTSWFKIKIPFDYQKCYLKPKQFENTYAPNHIHQILSFMAADVSLAKGLGGALHPYVDRLI